MWGSFRNGLGCRRGMRPREGGGVSLWEGSLVLGWGCLGEGHMIPLTKVIER